MVEPNQDELKQITQTFKINDPESMRLIHTQEKKALEGGIGKSNQGKEPSDSPSTTETTITRIWRARKDGCEACNQTGYKGRIGIYEVLRNSEGIQKLIVANSTSELINQQAIKEGMVTMQTDGFIKALRGQTTIEEILRVTATGES